MSFHLRDTLLRQAISEKVYYKTNGLRRENSIPRKVNARLAGSPLVIIMCGLPARGKSYTTKKLCTYLSWIGFDVKAFNAGNKRRELNHGGGQDASFFSSDTSSVEQLAEIASLAFDDLVSWLHSGGHVGVFDATNTTIERRRFLIERCEQSSLPPPLFIESICTDQLLLDKNYRLKLKNDDYKNWDPEEALTDFIERVKSYESRYETVGDNEAEDDLKYIKVFNVGRKIIVNNCTGWLSTQVVSILQNFHVSPRRILLTRHGESEDYVLRKIGGDSGLTENGKRFALKLQEFVNTLRNVSPEAEEDIDIDNPHDFSDQNRRPLMLLSSTLKRSLDTIAPLCSKSEDKENFSFDSLIFQQDDEDSMDVFSTTSLNEISSGTFDGMTYSEIKEKYPKEYEMRLNNKVSFRYPGGESYLDVVQRMQPIVHELERQKNDVLIVCHTAPIRMLLAYFLGKPIEEFVDEKIPMHTVFEVKPRAYGCDLIKHSLMDHSF